jgi:hypothetical protein
LTSKLPSMGLCIRAVINPMALMLNTPLYGPKDL